MKTRSNNRKNDTSKPSSSQRRRHRHRYVAPTPQPKSEEAVVTITSVPEKAPLPLESVSPSTTVALQELSSSSLPSYDSLVLEWRKGEKEELRKHGKQDINQLHEKRKVKLILIDAMISHLNNMEGEVEKRNILAGAMFFVQMEISGEYWVRSADNSQVYSNIKAALKAFDKDEKTNALIAFARYFIENNLPANEAKPLEGYSIKAIAEAIPQYKTAEEPKLKSGRRLFGFLSSPSPVKPTEEPAVLPTSNAAPRPASS